MHTLADPFNITQCLRSVNGNRAFACPKYLLSEQKTIESKSKHLFAQYCHRNPARAL